MKSFNIPSPKIHRVRINRATKNEALVWVVGITYLVCWLENRGSSPALFYFFLYYFSATKEQNQASIGIKCGRKMTKNGQQPNGQASLQHLLWILEGCNIVWYMMLMGLALQCSSMYLSYRSNEQSGSVIWRTHVANFIC